MFEGNVTEYYTDARIKGRKEYNRLKARGLSGHLTSLDGLLKDIEIVATVDLGIQEIPLKKVVGTYFNSRRMIFSKNFMPLESVNSEFGSKWCNLCAAHVKEGIRDPIKVYEYLNYYYVMEGNKRVSVLKYFDAVKVMAQVYRLVPKYDEQDEDVKLYYSFLEFYKETGLIEVWLSKATRYFRLLKYLRAYEPGDSYYESKYSHFLHYVYEPFRRIYKQMGGDQLNVTTGDAFVLYAKLYEIPRELDEEGAEKVMPLLIRELQNYGEDEEIDIHTTSDNIDKTSFFSSLTALMHKKIRVGFVYARDVEKSGWTYSHELGRQYIEAHFNDQIETEYIDNVPEDKSAYNAISEFAKQGYDIIFTTSEIYRRATLRCALENPHIKFFNCSGNRPYVHMTNYFGRTYEPRFLTGLIAGAMTKSNIIGYTATEPNPEVISCINAFAMGVKMVNPFAKLLVVWTGEWNNPKVSTDLSEKLIERGADIVSNKNIIVPRDVTWEYGVYSMLCNIDPETKQPEKYLASPIWLWGTFYEKIIASILNGTYQKVTSQMSDEGRLVNFWWGIASGVIDIYYSKKHVPAETAKLIDLMKKMIMSDQYHPFSGPIYDQNDNLRVEENTILSPEAILEMDWYVDNVQIIL